MLMMIKLFALYVKVATLEIINPFSVKNKISIVKNIMIKENAFNAI